MAVPATARTWAAGEIPTAAQLNTDVRDAITFFKTPPRVSVRHSVNVDLARITWHCLTWDTETSPDVDTDGFRSGSTTRLTVPAGFAGIYAVYAQIRWEWFGDATGCRGVQIRRNAGASSAGGNRVCGDFRHHQDNVAVGDQTQMTTGFVALAATDYIECFVWHDNDQLFGSDNSEIYHTGSGGLNPVGGVATTAKTTHFQMIWVRQ